MKNRIKNSCLTCLLSVLGFAASAQSSDFSITPNIGLTSPVLDEGVGFHIGVNPSYYLTSWLSLEGQVSYSYTSIRSTFINGNSGEAFSVNTLAGGRVYLLPSHMLTRLYANLLLGVNYFNEEVNEVPQEAELGLGASVGLYVETTKFVFGVSYDTPENLVLKVGYRL